MAGNGTTADWTRTPVLQQDCPACSPGVMVLPPRLSAIIGKESRRFLDGLDTNFSRLRLTPP
jgi:hypothetical protein